MVKFTKNFLMLLYWYLSMTSANIIINNVTYYNLPRFWTNTGFCPNGDKTHIDITKSLLSDDVKMSLSYLGALPNSGISSVRIHWLLELIEFVGFGKHGIPEYNFSQLDTILNWLEDEQLSVGFEFMGNPGRIFSKNVTGNPFLWEDLAFQISKRYLNRFGENQLSRWKFESWNEPDLRNYNLLNWTTNDYHQYLRSLRRGLNAGGRRPLKNIFWELRGPAGLFKAYDHHPLCWSILEKCNNSTYNCPIDILTFHRKGTGNAVDVINGSQSLLQKMFEKFPHISKLKISNDEADPISGWSTPRDFHSDVRYAVTLVQIVFDHWTAKLKRMEFRNLESISHDNAFLSYHPNEFTQRTLLARFQMNNTSPKSYSQFIQKPVYAALGMLGQLGNHAAEIINFDNNDCKIQMLKSSYSVNEPKYQAFLLISTNFTVKRCSFNFSDPLINSNNLKKNERLSYINEALEFGETDPVAVWKHYNSPSYPNATTRKSLRHSQGPRLISNAYLYENKINFEISLRSPWISLIRICSDFITKPRPPTNVRVQAITTGEVLITWKEEPKETFNPCIKTYEVFFSVNNDKWIQISTGWHIPFMLFHFQPTDGVIKGSYKVRSIDIFQRTGAFSTNHNFLRDH